MKTFLAWVGGISIALMIIAAIWNLAAKRDFLPNAGKAEDWALRSFVVYQSLNTNAAFGPPWTVTDKGDTWVVSSETGLKCLLNKKTGNSRFGPVDK